MDLLRVVLRDCHFSYNDISSSKKTKKDIEVSFSRLVVSFHNTFLENTFKTHVKFLKSELTTVEQAQELANYIAKMNNIIDSPELHVVDREPKYIIALITKATMYDIAKLLIVLSRFPLLENHEENIL